ncbi:hypothetical protein EON64_14750, partial [archaeon]
MKDYEAIVEKIKKGHAHATHGHTKAESTGFDLTKVSKNKVEKGSRRVAVNVSDTASGKHSGGAAAAGKSTPSSRAAAGNASNTRRKSFDSGAAKKGNSSETPNVTAAPSPAPTDTLHDAAAQLTPGASTIAASTAVEHIISDSWDSVTHQPYCNLCQMAFKSLTFLERHVKFSDLHQTNVKKAQGQVVTVSIPVSAATKTATPGEPQDSNEGSKKGGMPAASKQVEGQHFKLLYTGSKFFWRTQDNVDLHFYHHILPHTIEVIPYDSTRSKELPRIYLDYTCLMTNVTKHHKQTTGQELDEDENNRTAVTTYILQRLQLATSGTSSHMLTDSLHSASASRIPSPG